MSLKKTIRQKQTVFVLLVQRFYPVPSILPVSVYANPDPLHRQAALLINQERSRLGLTEDATADNWSEKLTEMRRDPRYEIHLDVAVTSATLITADRV